jgi:monoamine oxidase
MKASRREVVAGLAATAVAGGAGALLPRPLRAAPRRSDVLVIGAGLSGLHAATQLQELGIDVQVIEANTRVGGRVWTRRELHGRPETGAHQVGANYGRVRDNCRRYGVVLEDPLPGNAGELNVFEFAVSTQGSQVRKEPWSAAELARLSPAERGIPPYDLYKHYIKENPLPGPDAADDPRFASYRSMSLRDLFRQRGASDAALRILEGQTIAASLADYCALDELKRWAIWRLDAQRGTYSVMRDGTSALPEAMARALAKPVALGRTAVAIQEERDGVRVTCTDGEVWRARYVICSIPLGVLRRTRLDLPLAANQRKAIAELPYSSQIQVYLRPLRRFWEDDGLPRNTWTDGPLEVVMWAPSHTAPEGYIHTAINGWQADAVRKVPPDQRKDYVLKTLAQIRPATAGAVEYTTSHDFETSRFTRGAYCYLKPGQYGAIGDALQRPAGRVHFCGEHASNLFAGMEGACESGEQAVLALAQRLQA